MFCLTTYTKVFNDKTEMEKNKYCWVIKRLFTNKDLQVLVTKQLILSTVVSTQLLWYKREIAR